MVAELYGVKTWKEYGSDIDEFIEKIGFQTFNLVVGVSKGGIIPAVSAAEDHNCPLVVVSVDSHSGAGVRGQLNVHTGASNSEELEKEKLTILLVDDLVETGKTLTGVKEILLRKPNVLAVKTATIYYKASSDIIPDYYVKKMGDEQIDFPYAKGQIPVESPQEKIAV